MYCKHCGKEIANDAVICVYCGCRNDAARPATRGMSDPAPITYQTESGMYVLMGLTFGGVMALFFGIVMGAVSGGLGAAIAILLGVLGGVAFAVAMASLTKAHGKKFDKKREEIARTKKIICDSAATINENVGWLFFTNEGLEFYAREMNVNTQSIYIPIHSIGSVHAGFNRIMIATHDKQTVSIYVPRSDQWQRMISQHIWHG